ncbi:hypothetical protein HPB50_008351 [Hyalomma asiaticum]|uniref:Uncharacterized protein n=1 Tax=Hyalomma asiaticum TaxID=266040 RepID=A0ACB7STW2_HYAAI|nr:hypothetical protein HPB50_008351 [Hyalomma asiaticum]
MTMNDADDDADEEEPREVPTTTETRNVLRLLRNKVECSGGDQRLMQCVEQLENAFLGPNAKQARITRFFDPRNVTQLASETPSPIHFRKCPSLEKHRRPVNSERNLSELRGSPGFQGAVINPRKEGRYTLSFARKEMA